jgi:hypothetical protein
MTSTEIVQTALRVLSAWISGSRPDADEVEILRQSARPGEEELALDELACLIVRRECEKELHESRQEREAAKRLA